jgi:hypothetical protein
VPEFIKLRAENTIKRRAPDPKRPLQDTQDSSQGQAQRPLRHRPPFADANIPNCGGEIPRRRAADFEEVWGKKNNLPAALENPAGRVSRGIWTPVSEYLQVK